MIQDEQSNEELQAAIRAHQKHMSKEDKLVFAALNYYTQKKNDTIIWT